MTEEIDLPDRVFAALGDPTRAKIVDWLDEGTTGTATGFAARLPISRQAVSRHLKELEEAGLIVGSKQGREVRYRLRPEPLTATAEWLQARADSWEESLERLADHLEREKTPHQVVTQERDLGVSTETAFDAFTRPEELVVWFTTSAEVDLRPGGTYRNADGDQGQFLEVEPPHRVRFTWDNPRHCPGTVVEVIFESQGHSKTLVSLTHYDLTSQAQYDDMNQGWSWALDSLQAYLETGRPIPYEDWVPTEGN